jgi:hypothetical protein
VLSDFAVALVRPESAVGRSNNHGWARAHEEVVVSLSVFFYMQSACVRTILIVKVLVRNVLSCKTCCSKMMMMMMMQLFIFYCFTAFCGRLYRRRHRRRPRWR